MALSQQGLSIESVQQPCLEGEKLELEQEEDKGLELALQTLVGKILIDKALDRSVVKALIFKV